MKQFGMPKKDQLMCSFVVPDAKQFGIKKKQVDEQIGIRRSVGSGMNGPGY